MSPPHSNTKHRATTDGIQVFWVILANSPESGCGQTVQRIKNSFKDKDKLCMEHYITLYHICRPTECVWKVSGQPFIAAVIQASSTGNGGPIDCQLSTNIYYNNPTRCSCAQSILFHCSVTVHVSGAFYTHHQEYINCIYSLRYRSYIGAATFLQRGRVQIRPR